MNYYGDQGAITLSRSVGFNSKQGRQLSKQRRRIRLTLDFSISLLYWMIFVIVIAASLSLFQGVFIFFFALRVLSLVYDFLIIWGCKSEIICYFFICFYSVNPLMGSLTPDQPPSRVAISALLKWQ